MIFLLSIPGLPIQNGIFAFINFRLSHLLCNSIIVLFKGDRGLKGDKGETGLPGYDGIGQKVNNSTNRNWLTIKLYVGSVWQQIKSLAVTSETGTRLLEYIHTPTYIYTVV